MITEMKSEVIKMKSGLIRESADENVDAKDDDHDKKHGEDMIDAKDEDEDSSVDVPIFNRCLYGVVNAIDATLQKHRFDRDSFRRTLKWKNYVLKSIDNEETVDEDDLPFPIKNMHETLRNFVACEGILREIMKGQDFNVYDLDIIKLHHKSDVTWAKLDIGIFSPKR